MTSTSLLKTIQNAEDDIEKIAERSSELVKSLKARLRGDLVALKLLNEENDDDESKKNEEAICGEIARCLDEVYTILVSDEVIGALRDFPTVERSSLEARFKATAAEVATATEIDLEREIQRIKDDQRKTDEDDEGDSERKTKDMPKPNAMDAILPASSAISSTAVAEVPSLSSTHIPTPLKDNSSNRRSTRSAPDTSPIPTARATTTTGRHAATTETEKNNANEEKEDEETEEAKNPAASARKRTRR